MSSEHRRQRTAGEASGRPENDNPLQEMVPQTGGLTPRVKTAKSNDMPMGSIPQTNSEVEDTKENLGVKKAVLLQASIDRQNSHLDVNQGRGGMLALPEVQSNHQSLHEDQLRPQSIAVSEPSLNDEDDEDELDVPDVLEVEEGARKRPVRRTNGKRRKIMGNTKYKGRDRIRPVNWCFSIVTAMMISIPTLPTLTIVPFDMAGWIGGTFIALFYLCSYINNMRVLYLCATVEPGIVPKIRTKTVNYQKTYKVSYRDEDDLGPVTSQKALTPVQAFFSLSRFRIADNQETDPPLTETLSYCNTCQIVRPPRSFHCSDCGVCIEVHDHHCPWMGTCIGHRNIRYFVCFLFYTSLHALVTSIIAVSYFFAKTQGSMDSFFEGKKDEDGNEKSDFMHYVTVVNVCVAIYSLVFFLMLFCFALTMHFQVMDNVTTNEQIRKKWNAKNRGASRQRIKACEKFRFMYFGELPVSRIQRYFELRQQTIETARERMRMGSISMISQSSFAASVGGGSVGGAAGFEFEDIEIEGNLQKYIRTVQKGLLKEIDNQAVLMAYGIDVTQVPQTRPGTDVAQQLTPSEEQPEQQLVEGGTSTNNRPAILPPLRDRDVTDDVIDLPRQVSCQSQQIIARDDRRVMDDPGLGADHQDGYQSSTTPGKLLTNMN